MRVLHPVTLTEAFAASGTYTAPGSATLEHFSAHRQPDGALFVRIDADRRASDRTSQLVEALTDPTGAVLFSRVVIQHHTPTGVRREGYDFYADRVLAGITGAGGQRLDLEQALPVGCVPLFGLTALMGLALAAWPGGADSISPTFHGYNPDSGALGLSQAARTSLGTQDTPHGTATSYQLGEERLWVLPNGVVFRRETTDTLFQLTQYAQRAGSKQNT